MSRQDDKAPRVRCTTETRRARRNFTRRCGAAEERKRCARMRAKDLLRASAPPREPLFPPCSSAYAEASPDKSIRKTLRSFSEGGPRLRGENSWRLGVLAVDHSAS